MAFLTFAFYSHLNLHVYFQLQVYSDGEYAHKFYSGRRMWGAYRLFAPSIELPSNYTDLRYEPDVYPTFLTPDKPTDVLQLANIHRYYYQGTPFDTTQVCRRVILQ